MTPQLEDQIRTWKAKMARGALTEDEMIEVVKNLREGRLAAQQAAQASKSGKAKKVGPKVDANALLDEMDDE